MIEIMIVEMENKLTGSLEDMTIDQVLQNDSKLQVFNIRGGVKTKLEDMKIHD
jgi:hypothetical protein